MVSLDTLGPGPYRLLERGSILPSTATLKKTLFTAGEAARTILLRHFGKIRHIETKGDVDFVTEADKNAEAALIRTIQNDFPEHDILCEESGALAGTGRQPQSEWRWVIDPLDGTMNFTHGIPVYSVSIGLEYQGEMALGLVVDCTRDEWFYAEKGGGAFLYTRGPAGRLRRKAISVSQTPRLKDAYIITGFPHNRREICDELLTLLKPVILQTHGILRLGSAALDLCWVACGRGDAFYEPFLQPWDFAAGKLLVEAAGGKCSHFDGKRLSLDGKTVLATNGTIHGALLKLIQSHWPEV